MPEGVKQSSLNCPPDPEVKVWVARYRHPTLQNAGKRPTRSKSFKDGTTSEHLAFQVALSWLWSRHETAMGSKSTRPSWVTQVLDKCAQCCSPTPGACTVLAKVQQDWAAEHPSDNPAADGSASSGWSAAEGSSEDISSADDQMGGASQIRDRKRGCSQVRDSTSHRPRDCKILCHAAKLGSCRRQQCAGLLRDT